MKNKNAILTEVAEIEPRPSKDKIYPIGTIIIQISATTGQVLYLRKESKIEDNMHFPKGTNSIVLFVQHYRKIFSGSFFYSISKG